MLDGRSWLGASLLITASLAACRSAEAPPSNATAIDPNNELPFGYIDAPTPGMRVPRMFVALGWALDDVGIASIRLFVDNKYLMPIDQRGVRDDVSAAFPTYAKNSRRHGWMARVVLADSTPAGVHSLMVQLVDTGGLTRDVGPVSFVIDPAVPPVATSSSRPPTLTGEMPFGSVDEPKAGARVPRTFNVAGWALDDQGVREIRVFVDRVFNTVIATGADRQDVLQLNAPYAAANPKPGWAGTLTLSPGPHGLIFQAVDTNGLTRVLGVVNVVVEM